MNRVTPVIAFVLSQQGRICPLRGLPKTIKTDNGSEFNSKVTDKCACERGVGLDFSWPSKATGHARAADPDASSVKALNS